ncbi:hypothetical protein TNIN_188761 [Trichonephila inaurata madagascariensis]|uniref:Uncharacterized protein n=1 Tax=Trichonephila inaurata madagascariensis TaxID=2747483 RepID=A0A8X6YWL8_9ARAC|nr:hypothetical protein TNIN_188761 [Trichonephila inaurata madagascariensis]
MVKDISEVCSDILDARSETYTAKNETEDSFVSETSSESEEDSFVSETSSESEENAAKEIKDGAIPEGEPKLPDDAKVAHSDMDKDVFNLSGNGIMEKAETVKTEENVAKEIKDGAIPEDDEEPIGLGKSAVFDGLVRGNAACKHYPYSADNGCRDEDDEYDSSDSGDSDELSSSFECFYDSVYHREMMLMYGNTSFGSEDYIEESDGSANEPDEIPLKDGDEKGEQSSLEDFEIVNFFDVKKQMI